MPLPRPSLPSHVEVKSVTEWTNYHGTIPVKPIEVFCTPDVAGETGDATPRRLARHGEAIRGILKYCFDNAQSVRAIGARWSLSRIIEPDNVAINPANLNVMLKVKPEWVSASYRALRPGFVPIFVQGGTNISRINRQLGEIGLALQTSGASDGHRIAGCIATGTHGSAWEVGAVHDTVLALHLVIAPDKSVLVQSSSSPVVENAVADWLQRETGIPTESVRDDELFAAVLVSLGSLGFVHAVILEATPIYRLKRRVIVREWADPAVWNAMTDLGQTIPLHSDVPSAPFHFDVVMHPYPSPGRPGAFASAMWKVPAAGIPPADPLPLPPDSSSDMMGFIGQLSQVVGGDPLTADLLRRVLSSELEKRFKNGDEKTGFPGEIFGPTTLPPGVGTSTEIVIDHANLRSGLQAIFAALDEQAREGRHLLGAVAMRFVPQTRALLGMNVNAMNTYIEMPGIRNDETHRIYRACFDVLETQQIPFTCHWGQIHGMTPARLERYFGDRVRRWKEARARLLDSAVARTIFASPILAEVGLAD